MAASVLRGKKVAHGVELLVAPASLRDQEIARREGTLDASLVSIVYVDQDADGLATANQLRLNDRGEFLDEWPNGFFDDRLEELFGEF